MIKYNKIIFLDLELTCWEDKNFQEKHSEIIEIGICEYSITEKKILKSNSIYIVPEYFVISDYCAKLTGITKSLLKKQGKSLTQAMQQIKNHYAYSKLWMTWGYSDLYKLKEECLKKNADFLFKEKNYINAKHLFPLLSERKTAVGLKKALEIYNLDFKGTQHCGKDDAINTCYLIKKLLKI